MKLKGFKRPDGTLVPLYTDATLSESGLPADAAAVREIIEGAGGGSIEGIITPQMYGAKADGATDDTIAFQTAVNAAISGKKLLYLPAGTYLLTKVLGYNGGPGSYDGAYDVEIRGSITMVGAGKDITIIRTVRSDLSDPSNDHVDYYGAFGLWSADQNTVMRFSDFTVDGGFDTFPKVYYHNHCGFSFRYTANQPIKYAWFKNITLKNFCGECLYASNSIVSKADVYNCEFYRSCGMGNISGHTRYYNCYFEMGYVFPIEHASEANGGGLEVYNCRFYNYGMFGASAVVCTHEYGVFSGTERELEGRKDTKVIVKDCYFENTKEYVQSYRRPDSQESANALSISGITVEFNETAIIEGNTFVNCGRDEGRARAGIVIGNFIKNARVSNNTFICTDPTFSETGMIIMRPSNVQDNDSIIINDNVYLPNDDATTLMNMHNSSTEGRHFRHIIMYNNWMKTPVYTLTSTYAKLEPNYITLATNTSYDCEVVLDISNISSSTTVTMHIRSHVGEVQHTIVPGKTFTNDGQYVVKARLFVEPYQNRFTVNHNILGEASGGATVKATIRITPTIENSFSIYDNALGKPKWWNGTGWVDATGSPV